jgi:hypothetical protein
MLFIARSQPAYEISNRLARRVPRFLRALGLTHQEPWFVATFVVGNGADSYCETVCAAGEAELVRRIEAGSNEVIADLLCVLPPWRGSKGTWSRRTLRVIYRGIHEGTEAYVYVDATGEEFCADLLGTEPESVLRRQLVARIYPGNEIRCVTGSVKAV